MRCVIVGLGTQGRKRLAVAGSDAVATIDPVAPATCRHVRDVPLDAYDAALVCTPDDCKLDVLRYLLEHGKHVLVEKPLLGPAAELYELGRITHETGAVCYTAYNHRFEPHVVRLKAVLDSGRLGAVYLARFFYGNGTACDVRQSPWRDRGLGVLSDLGSHLLDLTRFLFGPLAAGFQTWQGRRFENRTYDHFTFGSPGSPALEVSVSLLSWRNSFEIDVVGSAGSAHVRGLCKWGPSTLTVRQRRLPSGKPTQEVHRLERPDPTWAAEYAYFKGLCREGRATDFRNDMWINNVLADLGGRAGERMAA